MADPRSSSLQPTVVRLEAGKTYAWCYCGLSKAQPFCDGSHKGTDVTPLVWKAEESKEAWLCQCKHTKMPPFCDGSHKTL
jgi:CDGSH-type Zn-finger protein